MIDDSSLEGGTVIINYPTFFSPYKHGTAIAFPEMMMISFFTTMGEQPTHPNVCVPLFLSGLLRG